MEQRTLGKTGFTVTALGFGGGPVGFLGTDRKQVTEILSALLDKGINLIDTAAVYMGSEEAIGEAVSHRRNDYVLVSKCGQEFPDIEGDAWSAQAIEQTIDRSLRRLQTDHLDVMLLHSCELDTLRQGEALAALIKARDAGKIRYLGYSGDNEAAAYAAGLDEVAVLETSISICDQANIETVLPEARRNNVGVLAKRPIANAAWKDAADQRGIYVQYAQTYSDRLANMGLTPGDLGFSDWSEIALRFTLSIPGVTTAIVGTTNPANASRNLQIAAKGPLAENTIKALRDAFSRAESAEGKPWPGLQ